MAPAHPQLFSSHSLNKQLRIKQGPASWCSTWTVILDERQWTSGAETGPSALSCYILQPVGLSARKHPSRWLLHVFKSWLKIHSFRTAYSIWFWTRSCATLYPLITLCRPLYPLRRLWYLSGVPPIAVYCLCAICFYLLPFSCMCFFMVTFSDQKGAYK